MLRKKELQHRAISKTAIVSSFLSTTLKRNVLNYPTKRYRVAKLRGKKQISTTCYPQETHF